MTDTAGQVALADDLSWHHYILLRLRGFIMLAFLLPPPVFFSCYVSKPQPLAPRGTSLEMKMNHCSDISVARSRGELPDVFDML